MARLMAASGPSRTDPVQTAYHGSTSARAPTRSAVR